MRTNNTNNQKRLDKKWKVLIEAKKYLANNANEEAKERKHEFLCLAVDRVVCFEYLKDSIKQDISKLLGGENTYNSWLMKKIGYDEYAFDETIGYPKRQSARHAWVDWLIKEYKSKDE